MISPSGAPSPSIPSLLPEIQTDEQIGVLISGGVDSCVLAAKLLEAGYRVQPFYVKSDLCWQRDEAQSVALFLNAIRTARLLELVTFRMPMADLYQDHWSVTGRNTPPAGSPDQAVYLPGRNALLAIKPALWSRQRKIGILALGILAANPFADTNDGFFTSLQSVINLPGGRPVRLVAPLSHLSKREVMLLGRDYPLHLTFSCIAPVNGTHCGRCNKCSERQRAFRAAGLTDDSKYATDETLAEVMRCTE